jgi:hypothetical protein
MTVATAATSVVAQVDVRKENTMAKRKVGLDNRDRDRGGEIDRKHGNTLVGTLRETYGPGFAKGRRSDMKLENLLKEEHCKSLSEYLKKK